MYGALNDSGERVGNSIKSSLIGQWAGLANVESKCAEHVNYLRDLDRRKTLADRIRRAVAECLRSGDASRPEIERRLSEVGISVVFRHNDDGRLTGATFVDHRCKCAYNGSNLGKDLSANAWWARFNKPLTLQKQPREQTDGQIPTVEPRPDNSMTNAPELSLQQPVEPEHSMWQQPYEQLQIPEMWPDISTTDAQEAKIESDRIPDTTLFRGLSRSTILHENIDPEFRTLYKKKKSMKKRI